MHSRSWMIFSILMVTRHGRLRINSNFRSIFCWRKVGEGANFESKIHSPFALDGTLFLAGGPIDLEIRRHHLGGHRMEKWPLLVYNAQQRKVFQSNFWKLSSSQLEKSVDTIMLTIEWAIDLYHFYSNRSIISGAIQVTNSNLQWAGSWFIIFLCNEWRSKDDQREKNDQN
jgi:hypothetical protein